MSDDSPTDDTHRDAVRFSEEMIEYHQKAFTLPPTIVRQCDSIRNHATMEGAMS